MLSRASSDACAHLSPRHRLACEGARPRVAGKFLYVGEHKLYVRGVTYGTFQPSEDGSAYPEPRQVAEDFAEMTVAGINAVRTYTVPPRWLLDLAVEHGLWVMVGLPWEQHVTFLDRAAQARDIVERVRADVRACAGHPALLCYAVGNEIPASIVRWHGARRVERFLERLCQAVRDEDPGALVTYVNYPSTEYLRLPFVDFLCFNVYLETPERLSAYLARLQNIAVDRPLLLAEVGLDSRRNGEQTQAEVLELQVRTAFASGCGGVFVFAWTDQWWRGGFDIADWDFGLTDRDRRAKPALAAVARAYAEVPFPADLAWPFISVVVCSYNGSRTLRDCLDGLRALNYPRFEVIVVDDGSTDATPEIARSYGYRVISTPNRGLSSARNTGMQAAAGEIVAYTDDDARPDSDWLTYLAFMFMTTNHAAVGGPNIPPPGDGPVAECVANAPGGPLHVLLTDEEAEHLPGCNLAIRKARLESIGGFDPRFRVAGDDVDVCWRLQQRGWTLGFHPGAMVWHHRRGSLRTYWNQQQGYGKAEALLERKWPDKYNASGHVTWGGRLYGPGLSSLIGWPRARVYHGTWGSALFQSLYQPAPGCLSSLPLMPEWYLLTLALAVIGAVGIPWSMVAPMVAWPLLVLAVGASAAQAWLAARRAQFADPPRSRLARLKVRALTGWLHLLQPLARLRGRLRYGLTLWRWPCAPSPHLAWPRTLTVWSERWQAPEERVESLEQALWDAKAHVRRGGAFDRWDLEVTGGLLGGARVRTVVEEHGGGRQLVRIRSWPRWSLLSLVLSLLTSAWLIEEVQERDWPAGVLVAIIGLALTLRMLAECAGALGAVIDVARPKVAQPALAKEPRALEPPRLAAEHRLPAVAASRSATLSGDSR
jgi:O-antigen biosynthesis protein